VRRLILCAAALAAATQPASAQTSLLRSCVDLQVTGTQDAAVQDQFRFLCGQVVQAMTTVQPTVGIAFSGGAHTLGTATTIGRRLGIPRLSVTARGNVALADVPDLLNGYVPTFDDQGRLEPMGSVSVPVPAFQGDVVLGVYNGLPATVLPGFGAIDLLGSVAFVPTVSKIGMTDPIVNVGAGARLGILRQGLVTPGISVSAMFRTLFGDIAFGELGPSAGSGDPAEFAADLSTWSLRAGASMGLLLFDLAAGLGYDIYSSDVHFDWRLRCPPAQCGQEIVLETEDGVRGSLRTSAWNAYGNIGFNLLLLRVVGELGYQQPLDILDQAGLQAAGLPAQPPVVDDLTGGRFFLSFGLRLTL
jgi:hypothetical protein